MKATGGALAVVFDLDGTLIDSHGDIAAAARFTLAAHGAPDRTPEEIATFVGDGARLLLARSARMAADDSRLDAFLATFLDYYSAHPAAHTRMMPHATIALDAVSAYLPSLCTNKPRVVTERVLAALGLSSAFAEVVAAGDAAENKPHPAPLLLIAERLRVSPHRLVMVGDGVQDVECGRAAGAYTVAVLGGFGTEAQLRRAKPDVIIRDLEELESIVKARAASV